jgi:hypothetical protein
VFNYIRTGNFYFGVVFMKNGVDGGAEVDRAKRCLKVREWEESFNAGYRAITVGVLVSAATDQCQGRDLHKFAIVTKCGQEMFDALVADLKTCEQEIGQKKVR